MKGRVSVGLMGLMTVGLIALAVAGGSFVIVDPGQRGVVTRFGKVKDGSFGEGLNFKLPFIENVDRMNVQIQKFKADTMEASSKDIQQVKTSVTINYRLNPDRVEKVRQEIGISPEMHRERVLLPQLQESVKAITAEYDAEDLLTKRAEVRDRMQQLLQNKLNNVLSGGFVVVEFAITDFKFSKIFNDAIEAKVEARQSAMRVENQVRQAKAEADKKIETARGEATAIKIKADAEAEAIRVRTEALRTNMEILEWERIQKWDGQLPRVLGGDVDGFFLNVGAEKNQ